MSIIINPSSGGGGGPSPGNPTATAGPIAIDGIATTYMRSDAAPAVQIATDVQPGLVQPDGVTITISGDIISSTGGSSDLVIGTTPITNGTPGYALTVGASNELEEAPFPTGGSPGGSDQSVQYNDMGAFQGDSNFVWDYTAQILGVNGDIEGATINGVLLYAPNADPTSVALGTAALENVTTGTGNLGIGAEALGLLDVGVNNIGIGFEAGFNITSGNDNIAIGNQTINGYPGSGGDNLAIGTTALGSNVSGSHNIAFGGQALQSVVAAQYNVAIGTVSLNQATGQFNTAIGALAGVSYPTTGSFNTIIGSQVQPSYDVSSVIMLGTGDSVSRGDYNYTSADTWTFYAPTKTPGYTVATLPAAGIMGRRAYVTDALTPTFLGPLTGGSNTVTPVFDNGSAWVAG